MAEISVENGVMGSELGRPGKREILVLALASEVVDEEHDEEGNTDDLHGEGFRTNRFLLLVRFGFGIGGSGIVGNYWCFEGFIFDYYW